MGLINLHTNLKSLRFGNDVQGGGSSGLPYIQPGLPEDSPAGEYLAGIARNSADWPLRGGTYSTIVSIEDSVRVSRFLTDFPKGSIFTAKQVGLQKSNPRIETGGKTSRLNTQTYNLNANLLAQIFEQGTGIHIPRAGANTNELDDYHNKYEYTVASRNLANNNDNRLVTLFNSKIDTGSLDPNLDLNLVKLGISKDDNILFNYEMGPDSLYGDGNTIIFKATDSTGVSINTRNAPSGQIKPGLRKPLIIKDLLKFPAPFSWQEYAIIDTFYQQSSKEIIRPEKLTPNISNINQFGNLMGYSALIDSKKDDLSVYELQDFRSQSLDPNDPARFQSRNYNDPLVNIATRVGIGNPGGRSKAKKNNFYINQINYSGQDQVNMIPLYADATDPFLLKPEARDLIKFAFEVIDNDGNTGKTGFKDGKNNNIIDSITTKVHFRAFLTNFADNHSAVWNGQRYMGRGEEFFTYQGFTRDVSFQFKVVAQSKQEMLPLWQKLNYLASSLYPDYSGQGFMRGNLHKLTIGEYFYRTPGILKSMNISVDDNYPWEIKYTEPETEKSFETKDFTGTTTQGSDRFINSNSDADMMELPQVINVSCTFTPILNELPSLSKVSETTIQKKHILISDHGMQENFINRLENPASKIPVWNNQTAKYDPLVFNINTPNS
jgi:hypothetical protein